MKQHFRLWILTLGLGVGSILLMTGAVRAQSQSGGNCAVHASVIEQLAQKYGETRQSIGLASGNQVVEVFASLETGTWTIIVTRPSGITCMVAAGQSYEVLNEVMTPALQGEPT
ncbi:MAG: hypothetical protein GY945_07495 [Rhodobacteraceae bacterium]|nr:hypothetical protein [Paracoccaceae bacterium]